MRTVEPDADDFGRDPEVPWKVSVPGASRPATRLLAMLEVLQARGTVSGPLGSNLEAGSTRSSRATVSRSSPRRRRITASVLRVTDHRNS
jgi:hypothetical protein